MNKQQLATVQSWKPRLASDRRWQERALIVLLEHQTSDEQDAEATSHHNGVGFTQVDAQFLTSLAKQVLAGRCLSARQSEAAGKRLPQYAAQLLRTRPVEVPQ